MSYHHEVLGSFKAGDVLRLFDGPFADAVILGFNDEGEMKVARPYAYVSSAGTTGPVPLTGVEIVILPRSQLGFCKTVTGSFRLHHSMLHHSV